MKIMKTEGRYISIHHEPNKSVAGCPTDYSIMGPLEPVGGTARRLQANFDAFKFPPASSTSSAHSSPPASPTASRSSVS